MFPRVSGRNPIGARGRRIRGLALTLASPDSGLFGQGARFALTGGLVAGVYLGTTTVLADVAGLPFQAALISGFCVALMVHFTLQRNFVWVHEDEFALPLRHQAGRYLVIACVQYGVTALSTLVLPPILGLSTEVVYLATAAVMVAANFVVFRYGIFHARKPPA
jgi:putative flippase GtrA